MGQKQRLSLVKLPFDRHSSCVVRNNKDRPLFRMHQWNRNPFMRYSHVIFSLHHPRKIHYRPKRHLFHFNNNKISTCRNDSPDNHRFRQMSILPTPNYTNFTIYSPICTILSGISHQSPPKFLSLFGWSTSFFCTFTRSRDVVTETGGPCTHTELDSALTETEPVR
jgi:hypothetical protein